MSTDRGGAGEHPGEDSQNRRGALNKPLLYELCFVGKTRLDGACNPICVSCGMIGRVLRIPGRIMQTLTLPALR